MGSSVWRRFEPGCTGIRRVGMWSRGSYRPSASDRGRGALVRMRLQRTGRSCRRSSVRRRSWKRRLSSKTFSVDVLAGTGRGSCGPSSVG